MGLAQIYRPCFWMAKYLRRKIQRDHHFEPYAYGHGKDTWQRLGVKGPNVVPGVWSRWAAHQLGMGLSLGCSSPLIFLFFWDGFEPIRMIHHSPLGGIWNHAHKKEVCILLLLLLMIMSIALRWHIPVIAYCCCDHLFLANHQPTCPGGVCGSARRMEYTVLGDCVNLSVRSPWAEAGGQQNFGMIIY